MQSPQDLPGRYGRVVKAVDRLLGVVECEAVLAGGRRYGDSAVAVQALQDDVRVGHEELVIGGGGERERGGGSFCVTDEAVSAKMGYDRVHDFHRHGAEYIVSADMSCLLHMKGVIDRLKLPIKVIHLAQILNGGPI